MFRVHIDRSDWEKLDSHLRQSMPNENGAFFLFHIGMGIRDTRVIINELCLPTEESWESKGEHSLRPSGKWLSSVIGQAIECESGIGFVHSHPNNSHPPTLSAIDFETSVEWSRTFSPMLESPFVSMVWTPNGIEGMVFTEVDLNVRTAKIGRIETSGQGSIILLSASSHKQVQEELDDRQIRAIGALGNLKLRELSVAIIGCGGTGSPLAEQVARMGVKELTLIDPDILDSASNLRRVVGSRKGDLGLKTSKAEIVGRNIRSVGLELEVKVLPLDVRTFEATKTIIDSDVVITTTDTHSSRSWINQIAYQYSLPVIDVGVKVGISRSGVVSGMPADVRILLSDTGCLWCRRVLNSDLIRAENLPKDERIELAAEGYIQGVLEPQASLTPLNFFASSVALLSLLRLYSSDDSAAASFIADGWEHYFAENSSAIDPLCVCSSWRRLGDGVMMTYLDSESVG